MIDLTSARIFAGLEKQEANAILAAAAKRKFKALETIIRADGEATHMIMVRKGFVDFFVLTEKGQDVLVRRFVPGDVFGIASLLHEPLGYLGTASAVSDVEVLAWDQRDAARIARAYPRFSQNAFRLALRYIAIYAHRHTSLVFDTAQERLAYALTSTASRAGATLPTGVEVNIRNEDLASLADISIFTACRLMKKWERMGAVDKSRGRVLIRCPEKLLAEEIPGSSAGLGQTAARKSSKRKRSKSRISRG
jgi:CRP/FNR family transcriptional regulator, nitrogen oxide reductase regulator